MRNDPFQVSPILTRSRRSDQGLGTAPPRLAPPPIPVGAWDWETEIEMPVEAHAVAAHF